MQTFSQSTKDERESKHPKGPGYLFGKMYQKQYITKVFLFKITNQIY